MLLKALDDKSHLLVKLDECAMAAPSCRRRQILEESRILCAGNRGEEEQGVKRSVPILDGWAHSRSGKHLPWPIARRSLR